MNFAIDFLDGKPLLTGVLGVINGSATVAILDWELYDTVISRLGATATATAAVFTVLILIRKWWRGRKESK